MSWINLICLGWLIISFVLVLITVAGAGLATKTEEEVDGA